MIIKQDKYDGFLLKKRFAYEFHRKDVLASGNIIAFRAPMDVTTGLIDLEDSLSADYIWSDDAVNFCWEIPFLCPFGAVAFQRLFNTQIAQILSKHLSLQNKEFIEMKGDDIMVNKEFEQHGIVQQRGKASVSITYSQNNVAIGHTGINIVAGKKAPAFAYSTNLNNPELFMKEVCQMFYDLTDCCFIATTKVIV